MSAHVFTLEEARRAMPLVRRIASDLQDTVEALTAIPGGASYLYSMQDESTLPAEQRKAAAELREKVEDLAEELAELGVHLKGVQPVLVDFPSVRDGEDIFLCWALGEANVNHWHTAEGGFRSRQKIE